MAKNGEWERVEPQLYRLKHQTPTGEWTTRYYVRFKDWKGHAFLGALNGKALWRVSFNNPRPQQAEQHELLLTSLDVRIRDVQQGPDGNLYVATERALTGVTPDGTVMRIEPAP